MLKIVKYFFQSILIYFFFLISVILRLKISRIIFSHLFVLLGPFIKSKKIIEKNLDIFSKNLTKNEKKEIEKMMWRNYGMTFVEYMFLNYFRKQNSHIIVKGKENLSVLNDKNPVIFISGHFANFELMSMEITKLNIKLATIYRPLNNVFLNLFMEYLRKKYICKNQIKKGIKGVKEAIGYIKENYSIALMVDQRVSEGEKIKFFGKEALTTTLPSQLATKYNLNIIPVFIQRKGKNKFEMEFLKPINPNNFTSKLELSKKLNHTLENMIKKNPNEWIWSHNRWK